MNTEQPCKVIERLSAFLNTSLDAILQERLTADPRRRVLQLFKATVAGVPAYRQFLEDQGVDPERIAEFKDFETLPLLNKANYMQKYPLPERCKGGQISACDRLAVSSGSTGISTFWPRTMTDELDIALRFEHVFGHSFHLF